MIRTGTSIFLYRTVQFTDFLSVQDYSIYLQRFFSQIWSNRCMIRTITMIYWSSIIVLDMPSLVSAGPVHPVCSRPSTYFAQQIGWLDLCASVFLLITICLLKISLSVEFISLEKGFWLKFPENQMLLNSLIISFGFSTHKLFIVLLPTP